MKKLQQLLAMSALSLSLMTLPGHAGPSADVLQSFSSTGQFDEGIAILNAKASQNEAEALAARGTLKFFNALQHFGQSLVSHGFRSPPSAAMIGVPALRTLPDDASAAPITYGIFRAMLQRFVTELADADADLAQVAGREVRLPLNVFQIKVNMAGNADPKQAVPLAQLLRLPQQGDLASGQFTFDTTDDYWLQGYTRLLSVPAQMMLAHDFENSFQKTFHIYFKNADTPFNHYLQNPAYAASELVTTDFEIADLIAFVHLISWDVVEPQQLQAARQNLLDVVSLNEKMWAAARAETDNDHEWLPNAKQTGIMPVTDEMIDGWLATLKLGKAVLDGEKLVPHWRFNEGLNLKRLLLESRHTDLVLLLTGSDALPWLEQGSVLSQAEWRAVTERLGNNTWAYALWFN